MFTGTLDPKSEIEFSRTLQRLADATGRPPEKVLRQQGRLLAEDMAIHVRPRGLKASVGRNYQDSIQAKIKTLYKSVGWMYHHVSVTHGDAAAAHLVGLVKSKRFAEAQRLLQNRLRPNVPVHEITVGQFDGGDLHRRWRWRNRRRYPVMIVSNFSAVKRYATAKRRTAGLAKGALINAGRDLDPTTTKATKWVKRHTSAPGRGRVLRSKGNISVSIETRVRYAREALPVSSELSALRVRSETATRDLKRIVDHNIRRAMRGA